jgi:hypothetical protein
VFKLSGVISELVTVSGFNCGHVAILHTAFVYMYVYKVCLGAEIHVLCPVFHVEFLDVFICSYRIVHL